MNAGRQDPLAALRQVLAHAGRSVLYSSEFLHSFDPERMRRVVEIATAEGYDTKIIYYVRSIAGHAYSAYIQAIKRHKFAGDFLSYLDKYNNRFATVIAKAKSVVGRRNLMVRNYDAARGDIVGDFLGALGIPADGLDKTGEVNRSLTAYEAEFLRHMNAHLADRYQSSRLSDALMINASPNIKRHAVISAAEKAILEERCGGDIETINSHISGPGIGLMDSGITVSDRPAVEFSEFERCVIAILAELTPLRPEKPSTAPPPAAGSACRVPC